MKTYRTGLQIDNKTGLAILYGEITYRTKDVAEENLRSLFTDPHITESTSITKVWGAMNLETHAFADCHVDLIGTPDKAIDFRFKFSNGQYVSFSSIASDVYKEIYPPQWMPSHYWGTPTGPRLAFGLERWTRHDPEIRKTYPDGLISFIIADVTATRTWMTVTKKARTTPINQFTIPGTHDTGTWTMGATSQCQTMVLRQQLDYGVRYIDIRLEPVATSHGMLLYIYHGITGSNLGFELDILAICENFLRQNPGETVIMLINRNSPKMHGVSDADFETAVNALIAKHPMIRTGQSMPTLAEAAGKIVLATRHPNLPGIQLQPGWPHDSTGVLVTDHGNLLVDVQDVYKFGGITGLPKKVDEKWRLVKAQLESARGAVAPPVPAWFINYSSAAGDPLVLNPHSMAVGWKDVKGINYRLLIYLSQNPKGYYGTVAMDFPEYPNNGEVIRRLIDSNN